MGSAHDMRKEVCLEVILPDPDWCNSMDITHAVRIEVSMKELVEVIAKALVDHPDEGVDTEKYYGRTSCGGIGYGQGDRKAGQNSQGDTVSRKGGIFQREQDGGCGDRIRMEPGGISC